MKSLVINDAQGDQLRIGGAMAGDADGYVVTASTGRATGLVSVVGLTREDLARIRDFANEVLGDPDAGMSFLRAELNLARSNEGRQRVRAEQAEAERDDVSQDRDMLRDSLDLAQRELAELRRNYSRDLCREMEHALAPLAVASERIRAGETVRVDLGAGTARPLTLAERVRSLERRLENLAATVEGEA